MTPKVPAAVYSTHSAGTLTWNGVSDSKFYYIFGSSELTYSSSEIIGVVAVKTAFIHLILTTIIAVINTESSFIIN